MFETETGLAGSGRNRSRIVVTGRRMGKQSLGADKMLKFGHLQNHSTDPA